MPVHPAVVALLQALGAPGGGIGEVEVAQALGRGTGFPWIPALLLAAPAVVAILLVWLYVRTARRLRRAQLAPPVWLLPYLEKPAGEAPAWPPAMPEPDELAEQEARQESVAALGRRKRALLAGLALNFVAGWAVAGVYLFESKRSADFEELPPTASLGASVDTAAFEGLETAGQGNVPGAAPPPAGGEPTGPLDTAAARIRQEQRLAFFRRRDSLAELRRIDSIAIAAQEAQRIRDSVARAVQDSIARELAARPAAAPTPVPAPTPPPPPAPPPPDPAVERQRAGAVLQGAAESLVAAINARQGVAELLSPGPRRDRLVQFVSERSPAASLVSVAEPAMAGDRSEAVVVVQFQWRGPFGDTRRQAGRFRAEATRGAGTWRLAGLAPLDNIP